MRDLKSPSVIWTKAILFLVLGTTASAMLLVEVGTIKGAALLVLSIWAFCRAYYFAFYVIEKYVDPSYRFSGLFSLVSHLLRHNRRG